MSLMTTYIQEMQARYRELATERVEQRIARALLRLTSNRGRDRKGESSWLSHGRTWRRCPARRFTP